MGQSRKSRDAGTCTNDRLTECEGARKLKMAAKCTRLACFAGFGRSCTGRVTFRVARHFFNWLARPTEPKP
jgi:hypothetical protein